jgi:hypothetical protein
MSNLFWARLFIAALIFIPINYWARCPVYVSFSLALVSWCLACAAVPWPLIQKL